MATHRVAIAKASFAANLLRPDPSPVSRDEIARFHGCIDDAISKCSPANVQICKDWLVQHVVPSQGRITALAKYLVALSTALTSEPSNSSGLRDTKAPSVYKRRLHILYLLNDLLHHTKHHVKDAQRHTSLTSNLQPHLIVLYQLAAGFDRERRSRHYRRLIDLLDIWEKESYQSHIFIGKLRQTVENAGDAADQDDEGSATREATKNTSATREAPYVMPASHGDPNTPFYDLPAGNLIPHIVPNSSYPIDSKLVKPLQFMAGPADEALVVVVRDFMKEVDALYSDGANEEDQVVDIDEMGQQMVQDEVSGEWTTLEGYYGWSLAFCERMRRRKKGPASPSAHDRRGRSRSRSSSDDPGPRKRRRYSSDGEYGSRRRNSRSRSKSSYSRSRSRSLSRSRDRRYARRRSQSYSRSASPPAAFQQSSEDSRQPPPPPPPPPLVPPHLPPQLAHSQPFVTPTSQILDPFSQTQPPPPQAYPATHYNHNFPTTSTGLPIPPPPSFHQGAWPPPPPPGLPPANYQNGFPPAPHSGFVPPPPPGWPGRAPAHGPDQGSVFGGHLPNQPPQQSGYPAAQRQQGHAGWQDDGGYNGRGRGGQSYRGGQGRDQWRGGRGGRR